MLSCLIKIYINIWLLMIEFIYLLITTQRYITFSREDKPKLNWIYLMSLDQLIVDIWFTTTNYYLKLNKKIPSQWNKCLFLVS